MQVSESVAPTSHIASHSFSSFLLDTLTHNRTTDTNHTFFAYMAFSSPSWHVKEIICHIITTLVKYHNQYVLLSGQWPGFLKLPLCLLLQAVNPALCIRFSQPLTVALFLKFKSFIVISNTTETWLLIVNIHRFTLKLIILISYDFLDSPKVKRHNQSNANHKVF